MRAWRYTWELASDLGNVDDSVMIKASLCAGHGTICTQSLIPCNDLLNGYFNILQIRKLRPHFTDQETEAQRA